MILDLRAPEGHRDYRGPLANPAAGVVREQTELVECPVNPDPRVTGVSMACLVFLGTKDTEESLELWGPLDPWERMERGETMGKWDQEDCLVNLDPVDCLDLKDPLVFLDPLVCVEVMDLMDQKEILGHKENPDPQDSKGHQELRVCQDLRERQDPRGRRGRSGNQDCRECQEPTDPLGTQAKRGHPELRGTRVPTALRVLLAIQDHVV